MNDTETGHIKPKTSRNALAVDCRVEFLRIVYFCLESFLERELVNRNLDSTLLAHGGGEEEEWGDVRIVRKGCPALSEGRNNNTSVGLYIPLGGGKQAEVTWSPVLQVFLVSFCSCSIFTALLSPTKPVTKAVTGTFFHMPTFIFQSFGALRDVGIIPHIKFGLLLLLVSRWSNSNYVTLQNTNMTWIAYWGKRHPKLISTLPTKVVSAVTEWIFGQTLRE